MGRLTKDNSGYPGPPGHRPPHWATWLLNQFSPVGLEDELQGDLLEMYTYWLKTVGPTKARWRYGLAVLRLIRPFSNSSPKASDYPQPSFIASIMIQNYLKIAWRTIQRDTFYSLINIVGLTIGLTCGLLLLLYVSNELSYDRYQAKADQIYRIVSFIQELDKTNRWVSTQAPLAKTLRGHYPTVENYVRFFPSGRTQFQIGDQRFYEDNIYLADSTVFAVFSYPFVEGDATTALTAPGSIVLTRSLAQKFFGTTKAVGKLLKTTDTTSYQVSGVIEDVPKNSQFTFQALLALTPQQKQDTEWGNFNVITYLLLRKPTAPDQIESQSAHLYQQYMASIFKPMGIQVAYRLQPLTSIHLHSDYEGESNGSISYVYTFSAVAFFMLLLASINYMNLATARSTKRFKEVGLRKVMGSVRGALIGQFLTESVLMTSLALTLSLGLVWGLLPFFNQVSGKAIQVGELVTPHFALIALGIMTFTGFVSSSYPAFYLSSFEPATVLKGLFKIQGGNFFRKALVVTQFSVSLVMLICTWIVFQQLDYLQTKSLGYDRAQVLTIQYPDNQPKASYAVFRQRLLANPHVQRVGTASNPASNIQGRAIFTVEANTGMKEMGFKPLFIDADYLPTMGIKLATGRGFSRDRPADTLNSVLVNEAAVKRMGWQQPLGKKIMLGAMQSDPARNPPTARVVGVVRDFHQQSLYHPIEPLLLLYRPAAAVTHIKIAPTEVAQTLAFIGETWRETYPDKVFEYRFLDQDFESAYHADQLRGQIFTTFSGLTILIACLGLFGLATFTTEQRVKEIGVRKVLGASVGSVVVLLAQEFTKLVLFSFPIALPIAWYSMHEWLARFPYRTAIDVWVFVGACLVTLIICWATVGYQSIKAALVNPVKSLRSE